MATNRWDRPNPLMRKDSSVSLSKKLEIGITHNGFIDCVLIAACMESSNCSTRACRHCRYYTPEGRRGGHCHQLNVAVQSSWRACSLAIPPFAPAWENLEEIMRWQEQSLAGQEAVDPAAPPVLPEVVPVEVVAEPAPLHQRPTTGIRALWM